VSEQEALMALRASYRNYKRSCKITKQVEQRRLARNPDLHYSALSVPGWIYYPGRDSVARSQ